MSKIEVIIDKIREILENREEKPKDIIGSYIVGVTIADPDAESLFKEYPMLEIIAELGAELETLGGSAHADEVLQDIENKYHELKRLQNSRR